MDPADLVDIEHLPDLATLRLAVIDVETTGLSPVEHHLLQVAVVVIDGCGGDVVRWASDVRPPGGAFARLGPRHIHGLTRRRLWRAPRVDEVLRRLAPLLEGTVVAGHNVAFDLSFLHEASRQTGVALPLRPRLCTLELSRRLDPERRRRHRLGDLCQHYGVGLDRPHDALADAQATAALVPMLFRDLNITEPAALAATMRAQAERS